MVALSGPVDSVKLDRGLRALARWGHPIVEAANLRSADPAGYLAGDDDVRLDGLEAVLAAGARVLIAARGGYGATRLLDRLPWEKLIERRAVVVGFSDLTAVLNPLAERGCVQVHGPMVAAGLEEPDLGDRLRAVLEGRLVGRPLFELDGTHVVRPGRAVGRAVGGNLVVLSALLGTPYDVGLDGAVLFLEEVNEPLYRIDRLLTQLRQADKLSCVKCLIVGRLGKFGSSTEAARVRDILVESMPQAVFVDGVEFGHGPRNLAFPIGAEVTVDTEAGVIEWSA